MNDIVEFFKQNFSSLASLVALLGIFFEVSPIKINPVSAIFNFISKFINRDIRERLNSMSSQLNNISYRIDMLEVNNMRSKILEFGNSCLSKRKHTKEEFEHIIRLHTEYEDIIKKMEIENGQVDLAFKYISDLYMRCLNDNSFLGN